eukprot:Sspe_Gene.104474::Locus_80790_Transcript_1_1_Confidence_1.000_Length_520::g.104474::m.104474
MGNGCAVGARFGHPPEVMLCGGGRPGGKVDSQQETETRKPRTVGQFCTGTGRPTVFNLSTCSSLPTQPEWGKEKGEGGVEGPASLLIGCPRDLEGCNVAPEYSDSGW